MSGGRSDTHEYHALWWHFGPYGTQDVHIHSCITDGHGPNDEGPDAGCSEVLIGWGQDCGKDVEHRRANLEDKASVDTAVADLRPKPEFLQAVTITVVGRPGAWNAALDANLGDSPGADRRESNAVAATIQRAVTMALAAAGMYDKADA